MVKQLGIPTYFLTLPCADLRWEELPYIINKLKNLRLSDKELKKNTYQEQFYLLNNNRVLVDIFSTKFKYFSKKLHLMVHWGKQNIMLYELNFKKGLAHISIHFYGL